VNQRSFPFTLFRKQSGQSATEFAFMFPMFLATFIGLMSVAFLFYSYLTAQLAVREGASALVHDPTQTIYAIRSIVCNDTFSLDRSQVAVNVSPPDSAGTAAASCSSLNSSEGAYLYWDSGVPLNVTAFYTVPLPTVSLPTMSSGRNSVLLGPIQIKAMSNVTIP
jgi:Flp pilus assembly protein TadG